MVYPLAGFSQIQTNLEVLEQQYENMFKDAFSRIALTDTNGVIEKPNAGLDYSWLIEKYALLALTQAGIQNVYLGNAPGKVEQVLQLKYTPVSQLITYQKAQAKSVERTCEIELHLELVDSQQKVLFSESLKESYQDTLKKRDIKSVENVELAYTHGRQQGSLLSKIYEPILISVITGMVIFLFYSYRSQ